LKRKHKKDIAFLLVWDSNSCTESFLNKFTFFATTLFLSI
jgi:preprotein translocase subunit SecG